MSETSTSSNSSQGTSSSTPVQTPENDIMNQISGVASGMASQLYNWAQGVFAKTSAITDQAVGNFFQVSQQMQGLSQGMINQYNNLFAPENKQLVQDANSYASPARLAADMGAAGATAAQAGQAAEQNSLQQLQQFGIDPSSGRYAGLINADNVQNAANVAGQENLQNRADVATGQQLRAQAVQVGAQLPSSIANTENTGIQANTGAENAELANANTGANLFQVPNSYLGTAMGVKMPFNGQKSQSSSLGGSNSQKQSPSRNEGGGSGAQPGGGQPGGNGPAWGMNNPAYGNNYQPYRPPGGGSANDWGGGVNNDAFGGVNPGDFTGGNIYNPDPNGGEDLGFGNGSQSGFMGVGGAGTGDSPLQGMDFGSGFGGFNSPAGDSGFGQTFNGGQDNGFNGMGGGTNTEFGNISYDQGANQGQMPSGWNDSSVQTDFAPPPSYDNSASGTTANYNPDEYGDNSYAYSDTNSGVSEDFARGGAVPSRMRRPPAYRMPNMMAQGGQVPAQASPSGGQQVDDVRAQGPGQAPMRLNANEFVIPQDVALWKGQEFFQNMINQSRKARMGAPAKPTTKPTGGQ